MAILIHGDAAFPGQGTVAETLNLSQLTGYRTGGTIHIIANNTIGFTTESQDSRSTRYASDLAKGYEIPILHVNSWLQTALFPGKAWKEWMLRFLIS
ncbi:Probable 2-oxoglutarate dehydrogenase SucA [Mycobacteroides abscessus subsp. abscessus]|nr:Probable 2-oxoglutarate dehydrogenase SucA [Mycobacteroides abscessus subsp. abscessus]